MDLIATFSDEDHMNGTYDVVDEYGVHMTGTWNLHR
jgi:hypothetical protein